MPDHAPDNSGQITEWNGLLGQRWVESQREIDAIVSPFGDEGLLASAPQPGERVLDVGCGCGATSLEIARRVGVTGAVLGVDVSQPMLAVARAQALRDRLPNLAFSEGDAAAATLPRGNDLLFSRFGVMFFSDPTQAFAHMRTSLRQGGRCVFVCWRKPRDNPWAMAPLVAARNALGITQEPADPNAPGPFAFADDARVRGILAGAGFSEILIRRFDASLLLGAAPRAAAESTVRIGPVARLLREAGVEHMPAVLDAVERALAAFAAPDGRVIVQGSAWIVSAISRG